MKVTLTSSVTIRNISGRPVEKVEKITRRPKVQYTAGVVVIHWRQHA